MSEERAAIVDAAAAAARRYISGERDRSVTPTAEDLTALGEFDAIDLDDPISPTEALALLERVGSPATVASTGGRYFGFVTGGVGTAALGASVLATAWDQNAALAVMSPGAAAIDATAARWITELLHLPASSITTFCPGATVANVTGIVTGRDELLHRLGWNTAERGLHGAPRLRALISSDAHVSVLKALRVAGIGTNDTIVVPANAHGALDAADLPRLDGPTLVILQAGNVNTGHSDDFAGIIDRLDRAMTWVHIDGAFGLWAAASDTTASQVAGHDRADSWASDAHKWLNVPYDCGIFTCADPAALRRSMAMQAAYANAATNDRSLMNLTLQMSQAARAIPVWAAVASEGRAGIAALVDRCCRHASRFGDQLAAAGAEVLVPVVLNQCLVAFGDDQQTADVIQRVQNSGECWMGATQWRGRTAMRVSVSDAATTTEDVDRAIAAIVDAMAVAAGNR